MKVGFFGGLFLFNSNVNDLLVSRFFFSLFFLGKGASNARKKSWSSCIFPWTHPFKKDDLSQFNASTTWCLMAIRTRRSTGFYIIALTAYLWCLSAQYEQDNHQWLRIQLWNLAIISWSSPDRTLLCFSSTIANQLLSQGYDRCDKFWYEDLYSCMHLMNDHM